MTPEGISTQSQLLLFIFAGMAWAGIALLILVGWHLFHRLITPTPKPTNWKKNWEDEA